jgi:hypothetical protein
MHFSISDWGLRDYREALLWTQLNHSAKYLQKADCRSDGSA